MDIFTNLNHDNEKFKIKINKINKLISDKKLKGLKFICSIDCWGPDVEYVRYGFNMENAEKNMQALLDAQGVEINIHCTISALSISSMYLLAEKVKEWSVKKPMALGWNTIVLPKCFDIYHFGDVFVDDVDKFIEALKALNPYTGLQPHHSTIFGIKQRMLESKPNPEEVKNLYEFLNELDVRRNDNWKTRFPRIEKIMSEIINK
jgi:PHP family Zn ribbon phosphoesterase